MRVKLSTEFIDCEKVDGVFQVCVCVGGDNRAREETLRARFIIWAAGEFQYPRESSEAAFPGAEFCMHNSRVRSWASLPGDDYVIIGGCEARHLLQYRLHA